MPELSPPYSTDSEQALLSAVLHNNQLFTEVAPIIDGSEFYHASHRLVFGAIEEAWKQDRKIDVLTLTEDLKASGELGTVGGIDYLSNLINLVPAEANVAEYARIVHENAMRRRIMETSTRLSITAATGEFDQIPVVVDDLMSKVGGRHQGGFRLVKDHLWPAMERIEDITNGDDDSRGLLTGFHDLDRMLVGFEPGDLVVVAARPSMGKTAFVLNVLTNTCLRGTPAALVSLEMSSEAVTMRCLAAEARVNFQSMRNGHHVPEVHKHLATAAGHINTMPLFIDDNPVSRVPELSAKLTRLVRAHGVKLVAIDYLQLMQGKGDSRVQEITNITRDIKLLAGKLQVPIVLLSQLSRKVEERKNKRPMLSDLRDSGSIEQDADVVLFLYRPEYYATSEEQRLTLDGQAEVILSKQRNGPVGSCPLHFYKEYARFESVERRIGIA